MRKNKKILWQKNTFDVIIKNIHHHVSKLETDPTIKIMYNETEKKENFIRSLIHLSLEHLGSIFNNKVTKETERGHGKVDLLITFDNGVVHIIECKNYNGKESLSKTYQQINHHSIHQDKTASLIFFCNQAKFEPLLVKIEQWINENVALKNKPIKKYKNYKNVWKASVLHAVFGNEMELHFACYHFYFNPDFDHKPK